MIEKRHWHALVGMQGMRLWLRPCAVVWDLGSRGCSVQCGRGNECAVHGQNQRWQSGSGTSRTEPRA
eukprot:2729618-Rhodomonas_salina.6